MRRLLIVAALAAGLAWASIAHAAKHWGYHDSATTVGPEHWGSLPGNELCASGQMQTPIALRSDEAISGRHQDLRFDYKPAPLSMTDDGHTIVFAYAPGSDLRILDLSYPLLQFHFHAPSEHTLDGKRFPVEIHLVHVSADGKPAVVVGIFVQKGAHNKALDRAFSMLPKRKGQTVAPAGIMINAAELIPANRSFFHYVGSLTTPPCTEGLDWYVLKTPIEMDAAQIRAFTSIPHMRGSFRPLQNRGSRKVETR